MGGDDLFRVYFGGAELEFDVAAGARGAIGKGSETRTRGRILGQLLVLFGRSRPHGL